MALPSRFEPDALTCLLELTVKSGQAHISDLAAKCRFSVELTKRIIASAPEVALEGATILVLDEKRIQLALRAVRSGADRVKVARLLSWKDFEIFSAKVFSAFGYQIATNVRLKFLRRRMEIDLVAQRYSSLVAVDCKHWKNVLSGQRMARVANEQDLRAECLARFLNEQWGPGKLCVRVLPVVVCLYEPRQRFFNGCPLVSVTNLPSFAEQLPAEIAGLRVHRCQVSSLSPIERWISSVQRSHRTSIAGQRTID